MVFNLYSNGPDGFSMDDVTPERLQQEQEEQEKIIAGERDFEQRQLANPYQALTETYQRPPETAKLLPISLFGAKIMKSETLKDYLSMGLR
jgi:hypothetical protein